MITIKPLPAGLSMKNPAALIATGFGSGRLHPAPGTWGTLAALILAFFLLFAGKILIAAAFVAALAAGIWAVTKYEAASASHDSGMIVIDEWAGLWLALLFAAPHWDEFLLAFVLFRILDIWKPWPIRWLDKNIAGAWGVMLDDIAAGVAAGVIVYGYGLWTASF